ncbi:MAG: penicillin acylase family protein, partial [Pseudomonadota bacterium]
LSTHSGKLPVEFSLLEYRPEPFTEDDVLGLWRAMAWESSPAARVDPVMLSILARLGKERARVLWPTDPAVAPDLGLTDLGWFRPESLMIQGLADRRAPFRVPGLRGGAVWAVSGSQTQSGRPMTACTLNQSVSAPGFWYWARLTAGDFHLSGAFLPGCPVALAGTNVNVGWAATSSSVDDADLFVEALDGTPPVRYWRVDRWKNLTKHQETYRIRGASSESRTILTTEVGPLVSQPADGKAISLNWTGRAGQGVFQALYGVNRARNGDQLVKSLRFLVSPSLQVVWADNEGNMGTQLAGRVPVRAPESDGAAPVPAWTGVHDWRGFVPFDDLPSVRNPVEGRTAATDGSPPGRETGFFMGCYWGRDGRTARITELLAGNREHFRESFQKIQTDCFSQQGKELSPVILKAVKELPGKDESEEQGFRLLSQWDYAMNSQSAPAAVFGLVYQALVEELFRSRLGDNLYAGFTGYAPILNATVHKIIVEGRTDWLEGEGPEKAIRKSFREGISRGRGLMGADVAKWTWGSIHACEFPHPLAGRSKFLELLYDVGPFPVSGSADTVDLAGWSSAQPFRVSDAVTLRYIADMTETPQGYGISPLGISAHFFSKHYKDQTGIWLAGRTLKAPLAAADIRKSGFDAVVFKAAGSGKVAGTAGPGGQ